MAKLIATEKLMTIANSDGTIEFRVPVRTGYGSVSADGRAVDVDIVIDRTRCEVRRTQDGGEWGQWEHLDVPAKGATP